MDQDTTQVNNTTEASQPITPSGVSQGANQATGEKLNGGVPPKKNNKLFLLIIGLVLMLTIILIVLIFSGTLNKSNKSAVPTPQAQQVITPTPSDQDQEVSQTPITNQQDVINALGELDKANPDTVGADLIQNDQDASAFSQ